MSKKTIAVVDDEPDIVELIQYHLEKEKYHTDAFYDGESFLEYLRHTIPDLVILDLMLPSIDGLEICRKIRANDSLKNIPIIMLTAKGTEIDKIVGLEMGADDYVVKPFSPRELVARVKAVLRRSGDKQKADHQNLIKYEDLVLDLDTYEARFKNEVIEFTTTEFKLLSIIMSHPGWVYSRNKLLDMLWGEDKVVLDRTIDVHIQKIRKKLGTVGDRIKSVRGVGYKLEK
ncbi:MAG: response regulator transcription factor [Candidatus Cloacimonetes bacterium]|nr:response regulator transcription factor [Candidatus Cloacimonadota bacterium]